LLPTNIWVIFTLSYSRVKRISDYKFCELIDFTEIGTTKLGQIIIGLQQLIKDIEPQVIIDQLCTTTIDFLEIYPLLVDMLAFIERKSSELKVQRAADVLGARLKKSTLG
jgi:hypothetical protein